MHALYPTSAETNPCQLQQRFEGTLTPFLHEVLLLCPRVHRRKVCRDLAPKNKCRHCVFTMFRISALAESEVTILHTTDINLICTSLFLVLSPNPDITRASPPAPRPSPSRRRSVPCQFLHSVLFPPLLRHQLGCSRLQTFCLSAESKAYEG